MTTIFVVEEHHQVLDLWRAQEARGLSVLHLDAHCDMRGLLINRKSQMAFRIWDKNRSVDQGNFLTHAIMEGRVSKLRWVFNDYGGRKFDVGTVKYESDLTAIPYIWFSHHRRDSSIALDYQELEYNLWSNLEKGEILDIDWDFFAGLPVPFKIVQEHVAKFLQINFATVPDQIYVCYSAEFSHPSRALFLEFVSELARIFRAKERFLPAVESHGTSTFYQKNRNNPVIRGIREAYYRVNLGLRKRGIY
jgi:hypothetical protein